MRSAFEIIEEIRTHRDDEDYWSYFSDDDLVSFLWTFEDATNVPRELLTEYMVARFLELRPAPERRVMGSSRP